MKCEALGAQRPRHIKRIGEVSSTGQRSNSLAQPLVQGFPKRMATSTAARQRGMTWLEFGLVAVLLAVVMVLLLNRLRDYQELAERADMEYTANLFKSALKLRIATLMAEERMQESAGLVCENPVRWLERPPGNYFGEVSGAEVNRVPPGRWYFDPVHCVTGYVAQFGQRLAPDSEGKARVRYHVRPAAIDGSGLRLGLAFEPLEPYQWQ